MICDIEAEKNRTKQEYEKLLTVFRRMIGSYENSAERWDVWEDIITLRASFLIDRALIGLRIDLDRAVGLLRNHNEFVTERERQERDLLVAAIDNLVDFAVAEESTMANELPETLEEDGLHLYINTFKRYNYDGALIENQDVLYAAGIAHWWLGKSSDTLITYMTQGDERVRPWHLSHEGVTYRKREFPPELIPPIEWGCRCYLVADDMTAVSGSMKEDPSINVNPIFKESLATGGKIFSNDHRFFNYTLHPRMKRIGEDIKQKFYGYEDNVGTVL